MHLLHLPKLGYTMENGTITEWLVLPGSTFEVGQPLYEVETEKNVVQVEARLPGTLVKVLSGEDGPLPVGELVAVVADPGEDPSDDDIVAAIKEEHPDFDRGAPDPELAEAGDPASQLAAPVEGPAALAAAPNGRVRALPKVRATADRLGVDLASVVGTGPRGTLTVQDVERAAAGSADSSPSAFRGERRRLTPVQRAMAAGVARSWTEVPTFVQQFRVDMTEVRAFRAQLKEENRGVGLTALLAAAIAHAVRRVPEANATLDGDELLLHPHVHVGIAVRSDRGLVVPALSEVDTVSLSDVDQMVARVVDAARSGSLPVDVVPTITLSNLGGYGVETGMPLVTSGQAAIVFTGDIVDTPVVVDGDVVVRPLMGVAIGYDHRFIDGATGGEFSRALREILERPTVLLDEEVGA